MSKKMMIASIIIVLTLVMGIMGCGQVQKISSVTNFPHADGSSWQYKNTITYGTAEGIYIETHYFNGIATLESGLKVQNYSSSQEVVKNLLFNTAQTVKALALSSAGYYLVNDSGVYYYYSVATSEAQLVVPLPLEVGQTWQDWQRDPVSSYEAVVREEITVPAGTFNAIKVISKGLVDWEYYAWYADGVGLVKSYNKISNVLIARPDGSTTSATYVATLELLSKNF